MSSVKAVADQVEGQLLEDVIPNPVTHYGKSKFLAEEYILSKPIPKGQLPKFTTQTLSVKRGTYTSLDDEGGHVIKEANAGFVSPAEDPLSLAENILIAENTNMQSMEAIGSNAIAYYQKEFERESLLSKLEIILQSHSL